MFWFLFGGISTALVGGVQLAMLELPEPPPAPEVAVEAEVIAVPPKPQGAESEGEGEGTRYTEEACRKHQGDYREACFHGLALQRAERDPEGALAACAELPEGASRWECQSDVAEIHSRIEPVWSETLCPTIPSRKWRDQCFFGIALAWSVHDFDYARDTCEQAGQFKNFCRHDVNGEIAQVAPQAALQWCHEPHDFPRKWCYHGLGKYLGRTDPPVATATCLEVPEKQGWREQCFHGLGWALAEQDAEDALLSCREAPSEMQDSCYMGVSANMRRFDAQRSLEICELVRDRDDHRGCVHFARGG